MLKRLAFRLAASRSTVAERFAIDGNENEIIASLTFRGGDLPFFRIISYHRKGVCGAWVDEAEERFDACVPFSLLNDEAFEVRHFIKGLRITYSGYWDFVRGTLTAYSFRQRAKDVVAQYLFNVTTRFRRDRIELLKAMVKKDIEYREEGFSIYQRKQFSKLLTMGELYGYRVYLHPSHNSEDRRFDLLIESLVNSGELEDKGNFFVVTGRAIETISRHESEERRHHDNVRQSWIMIILTLVIAGSTLVSVLG
jgi:hypothetical protein